MVQTLFCNLNYKKQSLYSCRAGFEFYLPFLEKKKKKKESSFALTAQWRRSKPTWNNKNTDEPLVCLAYSHSVNDTQQENWVYFAEGGCRRNMISLGTVQTFSL